MSEAPTCVFCGEAIGPDQATAGRPPMAAHAGCADAALADDTHWDAIAGGGDAGDDDADVATDEADAGSRPRGRAGCLTLALAAAGLLVLVRALSER